MKATQRPHELGQSLWLDNLTRRLLTDGTLLCTSGNSK
jgi:transaldolase